MASDTCRRARRRSTMAVVALATFVGLACRGEKRVRGAVRKAIRGHVSPWDGKIACRRLRGGEAMEVDDEAAVPAPMPARGMDPEVTAALDQLRIEREEKERLARMVDTECDTCLLNDTHYKHVLRLEDAEKDLNTKYAEDNPFRWTQGENLSSLHLPESAYFYLRSKNRTVRFCRYTCGTWQIGRWIMNRGEFDDAFLQDHLAADHILSKMSIGFTSYDLAPHYLPVVEVINEVVQRSSKELRQKQAFILRYTVYPCRMQEYFVQDYVEALRRDMGVTNIDMLNLHWHLPNETSWIDALLWMNDHPRVTLTCVSNMAKNYLEAAWRYGVQLDATEICFSIVDQRPKQMGLLSYCKSRGIAVFAYGVLLGGLLTEVWLGRPEPSVIMII